MKFGGSSVQDAQRIRQVFEIVKNNMVRNPIVVSSAFRGVTDDLIKLAEDALKGEDSIFEKVKGKHMKTATELGVSPDVVKENLAELEVLIKGISLVKELTTRTRDYVASFGERMSCRIIASYFTKAGIPSVEYDAFDIGMITDDNYGNANPLPDVPPKIRQSIMAMKELPIITGYIGKTKTGDITTLGRNGSDYTASIVGAAIDVDEIQIWTDVDGIMTADPKIVPNPKPIETISFDEASELAYYGGRVLHPFTLLPAMKKNIPVRVLNTFEPERQGTVILAHVEGAKKGVKSIAYKRHQFVLDISSPEMLLQYGFLAKIFDIFRRFEIVINIVSTSEVSVSVTTDTPSNLEKAINELSRDFNVSVQKDKAIICVVGEGLKHTPGVAGSVFSAVKESGANIFMISQGASNINITFVINEEDIERVVQSLHKKFFENDQT